MACCSCDAAAAAESGTGSGRKRGPTLLETHKEKIAATTTAVRNTESLDRINGSIEL